MSLRNPWCLCGCSAGSQRPRHGAWGRAQERRKARETRVQADRAAAGADGAARAGRGTNGPACPEDCGLNRTQATATRKPSLRERGRPLLLGGDAGHAAGEAGLTRRSWGQSARQPELALRRSSPRTQPNRGYERLAVSARACTSHAPMVSSPHKTLVTSARHRASRDRSDPLLQPWSHARLSRRVRRQDGGL